eukprot:2132289-Rhodomonas_salina.3
MPFLPGTDLCLVPTEHVCAYVRATKCPVVTYGGVIAYGAMGTVVLILTGVCGTEIACAAMGTR